MRDIYTRVNNLRRQVFSAVANLAYEDRDLSEIVEIPFEILPGEIASIRESVFLERAILGERIRAALGLDIQPAREHISITTGIDEIVKGENYYKAPLINIIKFACHQCPEKLIKVTDMCQGCIAHPCTEVCPKDAVDIVNGKSFIDQEKCIKCGRCVTACPYNAIIKMERPCAAVCGMDAISSDEYGRADIDEDKCVGCGMCLTHCPFGAIVDKGQLFQTITAIKSDAPVYAAVAPAVAGQFGNGITMEQLKVALKELGFTDVLDVAVGADLCTIQEAHDFLENVPAEISFLATSCCPSWSGMAEKLFPELKGHISMALTPMTLTGMVLKEQHPGCKVAFIGPCAAKKIEATRENIRPYIDFVLTFEEVIGMFDSRGIDPKNVVVDENEVSPGSSAGRKFAVSGGVANAVVQVIAKLEPEREIKIANAEGLANCRKLLQAAKLGKYDGYLLEGMGCPGGCVGGAGTMVSLTKGNNAVAKTTKEAPYENPLDSEYKDYLRIVEENQDTDSEPGK